MPSTACPASRSLRHTCMPMKPAAPVTSTGASLAADRMVFEAACAQQHGIVEVAAVEDHRLAQRLRDGVEGLLDLGGWHLLLAAVRLLHGRQHLQLHAGVLGGRPQESLQVLREARAAVTAARIEEVVADARVGAYALAHGLDVGAQFLR